MDAQVSDWDLEPLQFGVLNAVPAREWLCRVLQPPLCRGWEFTSALMNKMEVLLESGGINLSSWAVFSVLQKY